jgi:hypothetical protein
VELFENFLVAAQNFQYDIQLSTTLKNGNLRFLSLPYNKNVHVSWNLPGCRSSSHRIKVELWQNPSTALSTSTPLLFMALGMRPEVRFAAASILCTACAFEHWVVVDCRIDRVNHFWESI